MSQDLAAQVDFALKSDDVPKIYINGFINTLGSADVVMVGKRNDIPVVVVNMSYTAAKSLVEKLGHVIDALEDKTGQKILTTDRVGNSLNSQEDDSNA